MAIQASDVRAAYASPIDFGAQLQQIQKDKEQKQLLEEERAQRQEDRDIRRAQTLSEIDQTTDLFFGNREEAEKILRIDRMESVELLKKIHELGPKIAVITDGVDGAYSYDGNEILFMKAFPINPIESTGAGDAFSSAFITALSQGKEIRDALVWGTANAASVMMYVGPHKGLLNKNQIEEYIKNKSNGYEPIKVN